jgi:hypothetical protein
MANLGAAQGQVNAKLGAPLRHTAQSRYGGPDTVPFDAARRHTESAASIQPVRSCRKPPERILAM